MEVVLSDASNIDKYTNSQTIKQIIKKDVEYKYFTISQKDIIISRILRDHYTNIKLLDLITKEKKDTRLKRNCSKFFEVRDASEVDDDNEPVMYFKLEYLEDLKSRIYEKIYDMEKDIESEQEDVDIQSNVYIVPDGMPYEKFRNAVCSFLIDTQFKYNFIGEDGQCKVPSILDDGNTIQVVMLEINTIGQRFNYPMKNVYNCPICENSTTVKENELKSVDGKYKCESEIEGETPSGRPSIRICNTLLKPDEELSISRNAYYYRVLYRDIDGNNISGDAISFCKLNLGRVTAAVYRINLHYKDMKFMIVDVKEHPLNNFDLPVQDPNENYIFTLQRQVDKYIKEKTGLGIWGLIPIKAALLLQAANSYLGKDKTLNVQLIGSKSTGKSMILKNYGHVLYGSFFLSALGTGTSIPALRGTMRTIRIMKEIKIPTIGYLGQYRGIHIDEMKDSPELLEEMKALLSESTYSNNKSDSDSGVKDRLAQVCISENLRASDKGMYIGGIRKKYREYENKKLERKEYIEWKDDWDLYQPLNTYDNVYLRAAIESKRKEMHNREVFWIDNYSLPLHDRFPFYFYLVSGKNDAMIEMALESDELKGLDQANALKTDGLKEYFESCIPYIKRDDNKFNNQIKKVIDEYEVDADTRRLKIYRDIVRISRIVNKRDDITEMDLDMLRFILSNTDRCLNVNDLNTYEIKNKPKVVSVEEKKEIQKDIDKLMSFSNEFGLSDDDVFK